MGNEELRDRIARALGEKGRQIDKTGRTMPWNAYKSYAKADTLALADAVLAVVGSSPVGEERTVARLRELLAGDSHHEMATISGMLRLRGGKEDDIQLVAWGDRLSEACKRIREELERDAAAPPVGHAGLEALAASKGRSMGQVIEDAKRIESEFRAPPVGVDETLRSAAKEFAHLLGSPHAMLGDGRNGDERAALADEITEALAASSAAPGVTGAAREALLALAALRLGDVPERHAPELWAQVNKAHDLLLAALAVSPAVGGVAAEDAPPAATSRTADSSSARSPAPRAEARSHLRMLAHTRGTCPICCQAMPVSPAPRETAVAEAVRLLERCERALADDPGANRPEVVARDVREFLAGVSPAPTEGPDA